MAGLDRSGDSVVNTASRDLGEVGSMVSRPPSLRIIASLWRLTQADTGPTAVFVDELDAGQLQGAPNRQVVSRRHGRFAVG